MSRKKKFISNLTISGIADKGKAVGRTDTGEVIFVEGAVPGDIADVLVLRKKKNLSEAVVKQFVKYSEDRIQAPCRHFGVCGGCKWQNLDYNAQLLHKSQVVKDCIRRIAKLDPEIVLPIIGCESNLQYRNKLEYSFSDRRWITAEEVVTDEVFVQPGALGFHKAGFFDKIVDIDECLLQDGLTNKMRNFVRAFAHKNNFTFYNLRSHIGLLRNMIVRNTTSGEWMVIMIFGQNDMGRISLLLDKLLLEFPEITSLMYVINQKMNDTIFDQEVMSYKGPPYLVEQLRDVRYQIGPKSFFQTNPKQAVRLFDVAVKFAEFSPTDNVYDLYTGLGSIALYIASNVKHVTGIEEIPEAIADANTNMLFNDIKNATFYAGDVKDLLNDDFIQQHGKPDVIITDPPRAGMHADVIQTLLQLEAPKIVYISCNPSTQCRDLALLSEKYDVVAVQPVDMFPHTHHIESVSSLILKK
ncbi:MAG: 23S rRNA (uracil(1939)-C(5))-methyltransferase RlmD [Saprospiraceae bacterium]|nr:23S rRNA (uracil(1939)-C(5))-methyltransferase RlmD [Saprospiraceae bacterium]